MGGRGGSRSAEHPCAPLRCALPLAVRRTGDPFLLSCPHSIPRRRTVSPNNIKNSAPFITALLHRTAAASPGFNRADKKVRPELCPVRHGRHASRPRWPPGTRRRAHPPGPTGPDDPRTEEAPPQPGAASARLCGLRAEVGKRSPETTRRGLPCSAAWPREEIPECGGKEGVNLSAGGPVLTDDGTATAARETASPANERTRMMAESASLFRATKSGERYACTRK
jgi:hypothetical protein